MDVVVEAARALQRVPCEFRLDGPGDHLWLATDPVSPADITAADLLVIVTAGHRLTARQVQAVLEPGTDRRLVLAALRVPLLDVDQDLVVAGSDTIAAMETFHHAVRVLLGTTGGEVDVAVTSEVSSALGARKRPDLFVRCGPGLLRALGLPCRRGAPVAVWKAVQSCLRDDGVRSQLDRLADRLAAAGDPGWTTRRLALLDRVLEEYGARRGSVGLPRYGPQS
ncbi:DUF6308 family protein [Phycicoccus duodecadis]|uniref:Uncharacterized protein n=1 Tax=Phycicoccus duodecadis TaxID=173053 RepID=A0A2N3YFX3_9MICO|nr:DUF6308 family protein [Phycicoccus duodecadis]PKW25720.1 hypothetical protein ATL31_0519 [Phycicoccus duodecadis]